MSKIILIILGLTLTFFGCATAPPLSPDFLPVSQIKDLQTKILLDLNRETRKANEAQYRKLVEKISEGVLLRNMFGDILEANPAFQAMGGYTFEELKTLTVQKITPFKWHRKDTEMIAEAMTKEQVSFRKEFVHKNGTPFSVDLTLWVIKDKKGNPLGSGCLIKRLSP
jgi:PAS domain S-box-containing protein